MSVRQPLIMQQRGTARRGEVEISGTILVGASGAVTSFSCEYAGTGGIVKNAAAGRYDITFLRKFRNVRPGSVSIVGPASAAFVGATAGQFRTPATAGSTMTIQLLAGTVDTDATSGYTISFSATAQET